MHLFFGNVDEPAWAIRGKHDSHPVAKLPLRADDFAKCEGLCSFLEKQKTATRLPWAVKKQKTSCFASAIGEPCFARHDDHLALCASGSSGAPPNSSNVVAPAWAFTVDPEKLHRVTSDRNGSLQVGERSDSTKDGCAAPGEAPASGGGCSLMPQGAQSASWAHLGNLCGLFK